MKTFKMDNILRLRILGSPQPEHTTVILLQNEEQCCLWWEAPELTSKTETARQTAGAGRFPVA